MLHRCRLTDVIALLDLPRLQTLVLEDCRTDESLEALAGLRGVEVRVVGRPAFDEEFIICATSGLMPAEWVFPPRDIRRIERRSR